MADVTDTYNSGAYPSSAGVNPGTAAAAGGLAGLPAMIYGIYAGVDAKNKLDGLGARPKLGVPKEWLDQYMNRLKRSRMYQGFSAAELNKYYRDNARQNNTLTTKAMSVGGGAQAVQSGLAINNSNRLVDLASKSAQMDREGRNRDLNAADSWATRVGNVGLEQNKSEVNQYDRYVAQLGAQMQAGIGAGIQGAQSGLNMASTALMMA